MKSRLLFALSTLGVGSLVAWSLPAQTVRGHLPVAGPNNNSASASLLSGTAVAQEPSAIEAPLASESSEGAQETDLPESSQVPETNDLPVPANRDNQRPEQSTDERQDPTRLTPEMQAALQLVPGSVAAEPLPPIPTFGLRGRVINESMGATVLLEIDSRRAQLTIAGDDNLDLQQLARLMAQRAEAAESQASQPLVAPRSREVSYQLLHVSSEQVVILIQPWDRLVWLR